jgi:hypothetical protein
LLCKWSDDSSEPFPRWYYENLFTASGVGFNNMVDFFRLYSHGNIDSSGSEVFGWFTLPHSRSEYTGSGANDAGRQQLLSWAKSAAAAGNVDLSQFFGVVVCMNDPTDLFGDLGLPAVVCDNGSTEPSPLGQEMLHGYGVNHARVNGSTTDYTDPFDVMSVFDASMAPDPNFTLIGPGLNAALMDSKGWLDPDRVWTYAGGSAAVSLRPHHRRDLPGFLVAKVGQYYVEFRMNEGWDAAFVGPLVLVHRFDADGHSYLMPATEGSQALFAGSTFSGPSPDGVQLTVTVTSIDAANRTANMSVSAIAPGNLSVGVQPRATPGVRQNYVFTVLNLADRSPVQGALVAVDNGPRETRTSQDSDAQGHAEFDNMTLMDIIKIDAEGHVSSIPPGFSVQANGFNFFARDFW